MNIQSIEAHWPILTPDASLRKDIWTGKADWDGVNWILADDWHCHVKAKTYEFFLSLQKGYKTDGGSIPAVAQNIFSPLGKYLLSYLAHDGFYGAEVIDRLMADNILFDMLHFQGMLWIPREQVYSAVRIGGHFVWDAHKPAELKQAKALTEFQWIGDIKEMYEPRMNNEQTSKYFPNSKVFQIATPANA